MQFSTKSKSLKDNGSQIDLVIVRADGVVNLCEIKYLSSLLKVDKDFTRKTLEKIDAVEKLFKNKKQIIYTLISTQGFQKNNWSESLIDSSVTLNDLFRD